MNLGDDDFTLFGLPPRHALDRAELDARRRELQARVHPDRFASEGAAAQRIAMQWAVRVNEAYQRLKDPLSRAAYICQLRGQPVDAERNTAMPAAFLMQQMEWREALDEARDARDVGALEVLERELAGVRRERLAQLSELFRSESYQEAGAQVRQLMFLEKFGEDVGRVFEAIEA